MALKLAILGFGEEGRAAYHYFAKQGADITIFDQAEHPKYEVPAKAKLITGATAFEQLMGFDKVLRGSPAIRPDSYMTDGERTSVTKEFFTRSQSTQIIGVTGTKGKGTISTLTRDILREAGLPVHLGGNVGIPAINLLDDVRPDDVVVLELSSFQLWDLEVSPHIAVVGMIEPEHLEVHKDVVEYVAAKANIAKFQKTDDIVIYHPTNEFSADIARQSAGKRIRYGTREGAYIEGDHIRIDGRIILPISEVQIPGKHNLENICAAITAAWQYAQDPEAVQRAIKAFTGLEHRLEFVREVNGAQYYNDSISTTVGSVVAAMQSFDAAHEILIIGGTYDKGIEFDDLALAIAGANPKRVLFVGPIGKRIADLAKAQDYQHGEVYEQWSMPEVVDRAADIAETGDIVILSPATASFKDFKNYKDRGEQFKKAVSSL